MVAAGWRLLSAELSGRLRRKSGTLFDNTAYVDALFRQLWKKAASERRGAARRNAAGPRARLPARNRACSPTRCAMSTSSLNLMARQLLTLGNGSEGGGAQAVAAGCP
jgi:hypothetical protein